MTAMKFVSKLFKFKGFGAVDVCFEGHGEEAAVVVSVQPHNNGCRCPRCGRRGKIVRVMEPRRWRDVRICGRTVWLYHRPREIRCPTHGRHVEEVPWAAPSARVSYRFEYLLLKYCQWMPQVTAARLLGLAPSTLSDQLHRLIERRRTGHRIRALTTLGIDEISYAKGHKYATLVYDLERSCVVWVGKGKARETIDTFFRDHLSAFQKARIRWACCDMSETFIGAIRQHGPNAQLVLDRFHVVKALNEAVDEVRKEQWRQASGEDRKLLKGLRWVLLHHSAQRSRKDRRHAPNPGEGQPPHLPRLAPEGRVRALLALQGALGRRTLPQEVDDGGPAQPPAALAYVRQYGAQACRRYHRLRRHAPDQRRRRRAQSHYPHGQESSQWI